MSSGKGATKPRRAISSRLNRALIVGSSARLELEREDDAGIIEAEIPSGPYRSLALREGETLLVRPRKTRVFLNAA